MLRWIYDGDKMKLNLSNVKIIKCETFCSRLMGFMFKRKKINYGLLFENCNSIHTLFMFQKIDVIMTDAKNNILYIYKGLPPFRIILPKKGVKKVYELPLNTIEKLNIKESN